MVLETQEPTLGREVVETPHELIRIHPVEPAEVPMFYKQLGQIGLLAGYGTFAFVNPDYLATPEMRDILSQLWETNGPHTMPLQIISPVSIRYNTIKRQMIAANAVERYLLRNLSSEDGTPSAEVITHKLSTRAPFFNGTRLNSASINEQLAERLSGGMRPPFVFDVLNDLSTVEQQSAVGYVRWMAEQQSVQAQIWPEVASQDSFYGPDPMEGLRQIREFVEEDEIILLDTFAAGPTTADMLSMAQELNNGKEGFLRSLKDVRKSNDGTKWIFSDGQEVKNVVSRVLPSELSLLEEQLDPVRRAEILEFLTDSSINWLWHPSWQVLINKDDLDILGQIPEAEAYATRIIKAGEHNTLDIPEGRYVCKPDDGNSGIDIRFIEHSHDTIPTITIPEGYLWQEEIGPSNYSVQIEVDHIDGSGERTQKTLEIPLTIEVRAMPPLTISREGEDRGTYVFLRIAPQWDYAEVEGKQRQLCKTNVKEIQLATWRMLHYYRSVGYQLSFEDLSFLGFGPAWIIN